MRIVVITQDDPFFLARNLDFLFSNLPEGTEVIGCIVSDVSPFGKKERFIEKIWRTWRVFGVKFLLRYGVDFIAAKMPGRLGVRDVIKTHSICEIKIDQSINAEDSLARIRSFSPDLLISIAGNEIFRKPLIDLAPLGCLNLHTALLPKYRGLMPSFWVLKNGEQETGVSVFLVDEGIDSGEIVVQERIEIGEMSQRELIEATKRLGMESITKAIIKIRDGDKSTLPNDDAESTYFSFPTRSDVRNFLRSGARFY